MNDTVTIQRAAAIASHLNLYYRTWPLKEVDVLDALAAQKVTFRRDLRGTVRKLWHQLVDAS